jgi:hypothetical protein
MNGEQMRTAHIVTREHEVGDRVLALCGKDHKVKALWDEIPEDAPICRYCVDTAIGALDEADEVITQVRRMWRRVELFSGALGDALNPGHDLILDQIADAADTFGNQQAARRDEKADRKRAKRTCTCEWKDRDMYWENPDCPIHGGSDGPGIVDHDLPDDGEVNDGEPPVAPERHDDPA